MITRADLHTLLDQLPEETLPAVARYLEAVRVGCPPDDPYDDEPLSAEEVAQIAAARAEIARGDVVTQVGGCTMATEIADGITVDPAVMVGKPVVKGTRVPVEIVLDYLAHNPRFDEFFADYPQLTMTDVQACLHYAKTLVHKKAARQTRALHSAKT
jgi:uncharacterized protein (DUF433 family)